MDKCCQVQGTPRTSKITEKANGGNSLEEKQRKGGLAWEGQDWRGWFSEGGGSGLASVTGEGRSGGSS